jgi:hypothetical protein
VHLNRQHIATFFLVFFSLILVALLASVLPAFIPIASASGLKQTGSLPSQGWRVCGDLGIGTVPGVGLVRQRFALCRGDDWKVESYCLNPGQTAPANGTFCSLVASDTFWCGDSVQQLQLYQIVQTPAPTPRPSSTLTPSFTPIPSFTPTPVTPTVTLTPPGITPFANGSPTPTPNTPVVTNAPTHTRTPSSAGPSRPKPGGPGNLGYVLTGAFSTLLVLFLAGAGLRLWVTRRS